MKSIVLISFAVASMATAMLTSGDEACCTLEDCPIVCCDKDTKCPPACCDLTGNAVEATAVAVEETKSTACAKACSVRLD